jgi:hypothetical protein
MISLGLPVGQVDPTNGAYGYDYEFDVDVSGLTLIGAQCRDDIGDCAEFVGDELGCGTVAFDYLNYVCYCYQECAQANIIDNNNELSVGISTACPVPTP